MVARESCTRPGCTPSPVHCHAAAEMGERSPRHDGTIRSLHGYILDPVLKLAKNTPGSLKSLTAGVSVPQTLVQSIVVIQSVNVVSGILDFCFNVGMSIAQPTSLNTSPAG